MALRHDLEGQHLDVLPLVGVGWSICLCLAIVNLNVVFASVMTCGSTAAFSLSIQSASGSLKELDGNGTLDEILSLSDNFLISVTSSDTRDG